MWVQQVWVPYVVSLPDLNDRYNGGLTKHRDLMVFQKTYADVWMSEADKVRISQKI